MRRYSPFPEPQGRAHHSGRAAGLESRSERRARSDTPCQRARFRGANRESRRFVESFLIFAPLLLFVVSFTACVTGPSIDPHSLRGIVIDDTQGERKGPWM